MSLWQKLFGLKPESSQPKKLNQINVIKPYLHQGMWVFDDPDVNLVKEPFVAGVPEMIESATAVLQIPEPEKGFTVIFSKDPFPGHKIVLNWIRAEMGGNVYEWLGSEGWLCPALLKYFDAAPEKIYIDMKPLNYKEVA